MGPRHNLVVPPPSKYLQRFFHERVSEQRSRRDTGTIRLEIAFRVLFILTTFQKHASKFAYFLHNPIMGGQDGPQLGAMAQGPGPRWAPTGGPGPKDPFPMHFQQHFNHLFRDSILIIPFQQHFKHSFCDSILIMPFQQHFNHSFRDSILITHVQCIANAFPMHVQ